MRVFKLWHLVILCVLLFTSPAHVLANIKCAVAWGAKAPILYPDSVERVKQSAIAKFKDFGLPTIQEGKFIIVPRQASPRYEADVGLPFNYFLVYPVPIENFLPRREKQIASSDDIQTLTMYWATQIATPQNILTEASAIRILITNTEGRPDLAKAGFLLSVHRNLDPERLAESLKALQDLEHHNQGIKLNGSLRQWAWSIEVNSLEDYAVAREAIGRIPSDLIDSVDLISLLDLLSDR